MTSPIYGAVQRKPTLKKIGKLFVVRSESGALVGEFTGEAEAQGHLDLELAKPARWIFAVTIGGVVNPMGYCAGRRVVHTDPTEAAKFHDDGHATEQEAIDCAMAWAAKRQT